MVSSDDTNLVLGRCDSSSANQRFDFKYARLKWIGGRGKSDPLKVVDNQSDNAALSDYQRLEWYGRELLPTL